VKIHLPRPYAAARRLTFYEGLALDALRSLAGDDGISKSLPGTPAEIVAGYLGTDPEHALRLLRLLESCRAILLTDSAFAISLQLSYALKKERERNRQRGLSGLGGTPPDWTLHQRVRQLFPTLRARIDRPASYTLPAAFAPLLAHHEHHHKTKCPPDVELLTEACYAGELSTVLTLIEEQRSANREPVLLYTRKAIYLGIRRHAKR
jgi:hypothetical protein